MSKQYFQLDPANYQTLPGLSLSAALRFTNAHIQLLSDKELYMFFEEYKRGGIVFVAHRYARLNCTKLGFYDLEKKMPRKLASTKMRPPIVSFTRPFFSSPKCILYAQLITMICLSSLPLFPPPLHTPYPMPEKPSVIAS